MPKGRTTNYAIWRACERLRLTPSNVKKDWDDNTPHMQSMLIAYSQIRDVEDMQCVSQLLP